MIKVKLWSTETSSSERVTGRTSDLSGVNHNPDAAQSGARWMGRLGYISEGALAYEAFDGGNNLMGAYHMTAIGYSSGVAMTAAMSTLGAPIIVTGLGSYMAGDFIKRRSS